MSIASGRGLPGAGAPPTSLANDIAPILQEFCHVCHVCHGDGARKGGVALDAFPSEAATRGDHEMTPVAAESNPRLMILYGSGNADGNRHTHSNLPWILAPGRYVQHGSKPMPNLLLSLADRMGATNLDQFGDATGRHSHVWSLQEVLRDASRPHSPPAPCVRLNPGPSRDGHPENQDVTLRVVPLKGGSIEILAKLFGGQGTIYVPSWSPDSRRVAFVSYQFVP